jgi:outer membrane lipoprotein-sorting protein
MKSRILACAAAAFVMFASASAFAYHCPQDMKKIDAALKTTKASKEAVSEAMSLRAEGEALHKSGKHDESVKTLGRAMELLGIK